MDLKETGSDMDLTVPNIPKSSDKSSHSSTSYTGLVK
jgi:hypothetical protein